MIFSGEKCSFVAFIIVMYGKLFTPSNAPLNALVIVIHGIGEHCGCYDELAEKFAAQSVGVFSFDLRGHGHSPGRRGHTSIENIKDDLRFVIDIMRQKFLDVPVVLFGHSLGAHIALSYAIDGNVNVQGIIASSPWLKMVKPPSSMLVGLAKWTSPVLPWITVKTGIKAAQLAQGGVGVRSSKNDPLLHKKISIKLFSDLWTNSKTILCNPYRIKIPLLVMHGTADPLTSYHTSESFVQNVGEYATFKPWNDKRHNLLNDIGSEEVFQYMMKWLSQIFNFQWNCSEHP